MPASLVTAITDSYARGPPARDTCSKFVEALFEKIAVTFDRCDTREFNPLSPRIVSIRCTNICVIIGFSGGEGCMK